MNVPEHLNSVELGTIFFFLNMNSITTHWIVDSGATCHISHNLAYFTTLTPVHNMYVQLPNKTHVQVHCTGTVSFNSDFIMHNVFYIPNFNVNLLSISALLK